MTFDRILLSSDPVQSLDEMLHPEKYEPPSPEEQEAAIQEAEREFEMWKREQALKRAQAKRRGAS